MLPCLAAVTLYLAMGLAHATEDRPVEPCPLFSDGVVLQRDRLIPVWGTTAPGTKVTVKFRAQSISGVADVTGRWSVTLQPEAAGGPDLLNLETSKGSVTIPDVMVGEVWLAAGQSNMFFKVKSVKPPFVSASPEGDSDLRFFSVALQSRDQPDAGLRGKWLAADSANTPEMSAVAFFFARELRARLKVPVGIIVSAVGGTSVCAWSSAESLASVPDASAGFRSEWRENLERYPEAMQVFEKTFAEWNKRREDALAAGKVFDENKPKAPLGPDSPKRPMGLFNGMINPLIPFSIRGILWYQGETDATRQRAPVYAKILGALIKDWRTRWVQPALPFLIVQLPAYKQDEDWVSLQLAQREVAAGPGNGMITTLDLGDETNVHPRNKSPVGVRLANLALADVYEWKIPAHSPRVDAVRREGSEVRVALSADEGAKLVFHPENHPQGFEIAGADGSFVPAQTRVEGSTIVLSAVQVPDPERIRYAGNPWPALGVFDAGGLPMGPFLMEVP